MSNLGIAFYVLGALFALYAVAATWRSRDATAPVRKREQHHRS
jgi:hypothetical protein